MMSAPNKKQKLPSKSKNSGGGELATLIPVLQVMENEGRLLKCILTSFQGQEDLLAGKIKKSLPNRWIRAPDQRVMLKHDWAVEDEDEDDDGIKLEFKSDNIRIGSYGGRKSVKRKELHWSKDSACTFTFPNGGCGECSGREVWEFGLETNPRTSAYRLLVSAYTTCVCGGDGEEEDAEFSCRAYIIS